MEKIDEWMTKQAIEFLSRYPWTKKHRIEIAEDGTVYVSCGGAYPLIFKDAVDPLEER